MAFTDAFNGQTKEGVLGNAWGVANNFISDKVEIGPSGSGRGAGLNAAAATNNFDFGAPQV